MFEIFKEKKKLQNRLLLQVLEYGFVCGQDGEDLEEIKTKIIKKLEMKEW